MATWEHMERSTACCCMTMLPKIGQCLQAIKSTANSVAKEMAQEECRGEREGLRRGIVQIQGDQGFVWEGIWLQNPNDWHGEASSEWSCGVSQSNNWQGHAGNVDQSWSGGEVLALCIRHVLCVKNSALPCRDATESAHQRAPWSEGRFQPAEDVRLSSLGEDLGISKLGKAHPRHQEGDLSRIPDQHSEECGMVWPTHWLSRAWMSCEIRWRVQESATGKFATKHGACGLRQRESGIRIFNCHDTNLYHIQTSFFHKDNVSVNVECNSPRCGFELHEDDSMKRIHMSGFAKNGKGTKGWRSCNDICSRQRAARRKCHGVHMTTIGDEEIVTLDEANEKFAKLWSKKVDSFTMMLMGELMPSKSMTCGAYDELEMSDFNLDKNLGLDYFTSGEGQEGKSSLTASQGMALRETDCCMYWPLEPRSTKILGMKSLKARWYWDHTNLLPTANGSQHGRYVAQRMEITKRWQHQTSSIGRCQWRTCRLWLQDRDQSNQRRQWHQNHQEIGQTSWRMLYQNRERMPVLIPTRDGLLICQKWCVSISLVAIHTYSWILLGCTKQLLVGSI